jgi:hypothetical protein
LTVVTVILGYPKIRKLLTPTPRYPSGKRRIMQGEALS